MSRRSIFGRSGRQHTVPYGPDVDQTVAHWKFDTAQGVAIAEDESSSRQFTYKTWVVNDSFVPLKDGVDDDKIVFATPGVPSASDLSASDIRGAVGGEAIPGMASSYSEDKPMEDAA